jgi:hypothetical protein
MLLAWGSANAATLVNVTDDRLWRFDTETGLMDFALAGSGMIQGNTITAGDGVIYGYGGGVIQKYSVETGESLGSVPDEPLPASFMSNQESFIYGDGKIYSYNQNILGGFGKDVETGMAISFGNGSTDNDLLAYGNNTLFTLDAASGWVYTTDATTGLPNDEGRFLTSGMNGDSLVYGDGILFGSNGAGFINKYDALTGAYLDQFSAAGTVSTSLIYGDGIIYTGTVGGELWQYDAGTGASLGAVNLPSFISFDPNAWAFASTVVPIPAAVWLFASALAGLGFARRK